MQHDAYMQDGTDATRTLCRRNKDIPIHSSTGHATPEEHSFFCVFVEF